MHKRIPRVKALLLIFSLTIYSCGNDEASQAELIFQGDVFLNTQETVDRFSSSGYTKIVGNIRIGTGIPDLLSDISTLDLPTLLSIEGTLTISQTNLINLGGISNLVAISSQLIIRDNPELIDLDGLGLLTELGGIAINSNEKLEDISGLIQAEISSSINIENNPALLSLAGFNRLTSLSGNMIISDNIRLTNMIGFNELKTVNGTMALIRNNFSSLKGLDSLNFVNQGLILENDNLRSLEGLEKLDSIGSGLIVKENELLSNFCSLNTLFVSTESLTKVTIIGNNYDPQNEDFEEGDCSN